MKSTPSRLLITHLLGLAAGGLLYAFNTAPPTQSEPRPAKRTQSLTVKRTKGAELRTLSRMIRDEKEQDRQLEEESDMDISIRELGLEAIRKQPKIDHENQTKLNRLLTLADTYNNVADLNPSILTALLADDDDAAAAIFLEWHQRDPEAAFDAMATREYWLNVESNFPLFLHLSDKELLAEAAKKNRPKGFRHSLLYGLGRKYGESDDLKSLTSAMTQPDTEFTNYLITTFIEHWVPDDGAAAAEFICVKMPPKQRKVFLEELSNAYQPGGPVCGMGSIFPITPRPSLPYLAWTDDFAASLFRYKLDISGKLHFKLYQRSKSTHLSFNDTFVFVNNSPKPKPLADEIDPEHAFRTIKSLVDKELFKNRDYPELFARGDMSAEEITHTMRQKIEGSEVHPEELARAIFPHLVPHDAARAAIWAREHIAAETLSADTIQILTKLTASYEPRTDRSVKWVQVFQPEFPKGEKSRHLSKRIFQRIDEWSNRNPEAAKNALSEISLKHPIWDHREKRKETP